MMRLLLESRKVEDLKPYERNVKLHGEKDVAIIETSIRRFGFNDPIGVLPDGTIVEGEGRWLAAQRIGMSSVPVLVLGGMSERAAGMYRIAHNKIALSTGFNLDALISDLRSLVNEDITLETMGFSDAEAARVLGMEEAAALGADVLTRGATSREDAGSTVPSYVLIWDNQEQKEEFEAFLRKIRGENESTTTAFIRYVTEALDGTE
jgi:ParB-like chromosome segregation protein Spo0J